MNLSKSMGRGMREELQGRNGMVDCNDIIVSKLKEKCLLKQIQRKQSAG